MQTTYRVFAALPYPTAAGLEHFSIEGAADSLKEAKRIARRVVNDMERRFGQWVARIDEVVGSDTCNMTRTIARSES